ncbi:hypothetical protein E8E14_005597 [Neopestalotiopsis sp. 37M]|nr:hypothetical protein E8E14_005597 [Neopestalotiopsis sp. 37M]
MEPASLVLGIPPLVAGAIKGYGSVKKNLDIFKHHSRELKRMQKSLNIERDVFLRETETMVLVVVDDYTLVASMLEDPEHPQWRSVAVDRTLKEVLGRSYDEYCETIKTISTAIQEIQTEFDCCDTLEGQKVQQREVFQRFRDKLAVTRKKPQLEVSLEKLARSNGNLKGLGEQARKIQEIIAKKTIIQGSKKAPAREIADFGLIRRASNAFYLALSHAWSFQNDGRRHLESHRHDVRFFLNTKVVDSVSMELLVACPSQVARETDMLKNLPYSQPLKLEIRSQVIQMVQSSPRRSLDLINTTEDDKLKQKKVRFQDDKDHRVNKEHSARTYVPADGDSEKSAIPNLLNRDLCYYLQQAVPRAGSSTYVKCVGYLDSCCDGNFRHSIYDVVPGNFDLGSVVSMQELLDSYSAERGVRMVDQLKLALSLVAAVLKFHSTPWLAQYITLKDISLFHNSQDFAKWLPTLHFGTTFVDSEGRDVGTASEEDSTSKMATLIEDAKFEVGIRNTTLWCLGVILLQIGHWSGITEPHDVKAVRQLSWGPSNFGKNYEELTRQVLDCDFGFGPDLTQAQLQQAVYERVYLGLAGMIDKMDRPEC